MAVLAHADDEVPAGPVFARYAREGVRVHFIIASDGMQGTAGSGNAAASGDTLSRTRIGEARCSADALGVQPPIHLGFPDAKLGDYAGDRSLMYRLTARLAEELARLQPDAIITWGPDGGTGHPDHRLVGDIVTQLARAGAPGVPERIFFIYIPAEGIRAMNPQRGEPPLLVPDPKYVTASVSFTPADLEASKRAMTCHRSQYGADVVDRVFPVQARFWNGAVGLVPMNPGARVSDLFR